MTHFIKESRQNVYFDQNSSYKCMMSVPHFVKELRQKAKIGDVFLTSRDILLSIDHRTI